MAKDHGSFGEALAEALDEPGGFDITHEVVIAHISYGGSGRLNPIQSAFLAVADHGKDGTYRFPGPHADTDVVIVVEGQETPQ